MLPQRPQCFPKARRLLKRSEFVRARQSPAVHTKHFVLVAYTRHDQDEARLGLVASRKTGNAAERNRAKRRVREWFRKHRDLPIGIDFVVILRTCAHQSEVAELNRSLGGALKRLRRKVAKAQTNPTESRAEPAAGTCDAPPQDAS